LGADDAYPWRPVDERTVDTMTADVIEAWEHVTTLAGRGLEL
jgi:hypothetical protein